MIIIHRYDANGIGDGVRAHLNVDGMYIVDLN